MKKPSLSMLLLLASCSFGLAQESTQGRIYIGSLQDAPAWTAAAAKASVNNQTVANAAWLQWLDASVARERSDVANAVRAAEASRAAYLSDPRNRMLRPEVGGVQTLRERGVIVDYEPKTDSGLITGEDGKRWLFDGSEWAEYRDPYTIGSLSTAVAPRSFEIYPAKGLWVDFEPDAGSGHALSVYALGPYNPLHIQKETAH